MATPTGGGGGGGGGVTGTSASRAPAEQQSRSRKQLQTEFKYHPKPVHRHVPAAKFSTAARFKPPPKREPETEETAKDQTADETEAAAVAEEEKAAKADAASAARSKLLAEARTVKREVITQLHGIRKVLESLQRLNGSATGAGGGQPPPLLTADTYAETERLLFTARGLCRSVEAQIRTDRLQRLIHIATAAAVDASSPAVNTIDDLKVSAVDSAEDESFEAFRAREAAREQAEADAIALASKQAEEAAAHARFLIEEEEEFGGTDLGRERAKARELVKSEAERRQKLERAAAERVRADQAEWARQQELTKQARARQKRIAAQSARTYAELIDAFVALKSAVESVAAELLKKHKLLLERRGTDGSALSGAAAASAVTGTDEPDNESSDTGAAAAARAKLAGRVFSRAEVGVTTKRVAAIGFTPLPAASGKGRAAPTSAPSDSAEAADTVSSPLDAVNTCIEALTILQSKLIRAPVPNTERSASAADEQIRASVTQLSTTLHDLRSKIETVTATISATREAESSDGNGNAILSQLTEEMKPLEAVLRECIELLTLLLTAQIEANREAERYAATNSFGRSGRSSSFAGRPFDSTETSGAASGGGGGGTARAEQLLSQLARWRIDSDSEHRKQPVLSFGRAGRFPKPNRPPPRPREYRRTLTPSESAPPPNFDAFRPHVPGASFAPPRSEAERERPRDPAQWTTTERIKFRKEKEAKKKARREGEGDGLGPGTYQVTANDIDRATGKHVPGVSIAPPPQTSEEGGDNSNPTFAAAKLKKAESDRIAARRAPGGYQISEKYTAPRSDKSGLIAPESSSVSIKPKPKSKDLRAATEALMSAPVDPTLPVRSHRPAARIGPPPATDESGQPIEAAVATGEGKSEQRRAAERLLRRVMRERYAKYQEKQSVRDSTAASKHESRIEQPSAAFAPRVGPHLVRQPPVSLEVRKLQRERPLPPSELPSVSADRHKPAFGFGEAPEGGAAEEARRRIAKRDAQRENGFNFRGGIRPEPTELVDHNKPASSDDADGGGGGKEAEEKLNEPQRRTIFSANTGRTGQAGGAPILPPEKEAVQHFIDPHNPSKQSATKARSRGTGFGTADTGRGRSAADLAAEAELLGPAEGDRLLLRVNPDAVRGASVGTRAHSFANSGRRDTAPLSEAELEAMGLGAAAEGDTLLLDPDAAAERLRKRKPAFGFGTANDSDTAPDREDDQPTLIISPNRAVIEPRSRAAIFLREGTNRFTAQPVVDGIDLREPEVIIDLTRIDDAVRPRKQATGFGHSTGRGSSGSAVAADAEYGADGDRLILHPSYTGVDANVPNVNLQQISKRPPSTIGPNPSASGLGSGGPVPEERPLTDAEILIRADLANRARRGVIWHPPSSDGATADVTPGPGQYTAPLIPFPDPEQLTSSKPGSFFAPHDRSLRSAEPLPLAAHTTHLNIDEQHTRKSVPAISFPTDSYASRGVPFHQSLLTEAGAHSLAPPSYVGVDPATPSAHFTQAVPDRLAPTAPVPYSTLLDLDGAEKGVMRDPRVTDFGYHNPSGPHSPRKPSPHPAQTQVAAEEAKAKAAATAQASTTPRGNTRVPVPKSSPRERLDALLDSMLAAEQASGSGGGGGGGVPRANRELPPLVLTAKDRERQKIADAWKHAATTSPRRKPTAASAGGGGSSPPTSARSLIVSERDRESESHPLPRTKRAAERSRLAADQIRPTAIEPQHIPVHPLPHEPIAIAIDDFPPARSIAPAPPSTTVSATTTAAAAATSATVSTTAARKAPKQPQREKPPPKPIIKHFGLETAASSAAVLSALAIDRDSPRSRPERSDHKTTKAGGAPVSVAIASTAAVKRRVQIKLPSEDDHWIVSDQPGPDRF